ncbi:hypothetical protein Tco_1189072 [Tanacetum coccineum]
MHRIPYAPRTPNPDTTKGESSAPCKPTVIRLEPMSDKESPKVKKSANVLIIHDVEEEEESARDALIRRKGKGI